MQSRINNPDRMKQLIDFKGLGVDGYIYPTDIDGLLEYKDSEYIIFEVSTGTQRFRSVKNLQFKEWSMTSQR